MEILETFAAKRRFVVFEALNHGAHGAVEHQDARIKRLSVRHWGECPANG